MKSAIKILSLWSLLAILISAQTPVFTLGTITGNEGDSVNVPITVTNLDNIGAITLKIQFAPAVLQWGRAINWNPAFPSTGLAGVASGVVTVAWDNTSPLILANGKLLDLQFKYLGGTSSLNFITAQCEIADVNGEIIAVQYVNGQVSPAAVINPPPSPALVSPANNSVNLETSNVLSWNAVSGVDYYKVEVSTSSAFTSWFLVDSLITGTSKTVSGLSNNTRYYWRVSAKNAGGSGPYSDVWNFTTKSIPAGPAISIGNVTATAGDTVLIPVYGSSLNNIGAITLKINYTAAHLSWNSVTNWNAAFPSSGLGGALNGVVTIAWDNTSPLNLTSGKLFDLKFIYNGGTSNITINTQLSEIADVNGEIINVSYVNGSISPAVTVVPAAPILSAPANNSTSVPLNQILSWNSVTGAETYQLQVSADANFTTIVKDTTFGSTSKQMWGLLNSTKYYWRVRANNVGGTGSWSEVWNFTTIIAAPGQVTLSSPANNAVNQSLSTYLSWNALSGAETYQLQVSTDANFTTVIKDTTFGGTSKQMWELLNSTIYYWRVRANNVGGTGSWSEMWNFTTIIAAPGAVTLSSPANNAVNQALNTSLTWNALSGVETYQLQVASDANFTTVIKDTTFGSTSKQMWGLLNSTKYYWRVRANNVGGTGSWSEVWNFTTKPLPAGSTVTIGNVTAVAGDTLLIPVYGSSLSNIGAITLKINYNTAHLLWSSVTNWNAAFPSVGLGGALNGVVTIAWDNTSPLNLTSGKLFDLKFIYSGGTSNITFNTQLSEFADVNGEIIEISYVNGSISPSVVQIPAAPVLSSPANNSTNALLNQLLSWNSVTSAETYQLQVATDANFTTIVKDTTFGGTSKQMWNLSNLTKYYWRVRANNVGGTGNWSEVWNFTTIIAAPGAVTLSSPANNATNQALNVTLNWNALSGAETYQLQVSTDASFTTIVKDTTFGGTSKQMWGLLNSTKYYWRVRANNVGGTGSWSEMWNFTTIIAAPGQVTLSSPANNATNQALNVSLNWNALSGAETYQLQVATDVNFTTIVKDTALAGTSKQMWNLSNLTKYYWRVRANNVGGTGSWSEVWNFTTIIAAPGQVTLTSPANNATNQALHVSLNWNALSGAETYQLQVSTDANFTTIVKDTTFGGTSKQMWNLSNSIKYYWRVRANNVGGTGNWSEVWNFTTIIAAPGAVTLASPANNATSQALNVTLNWNAFSGAETYQLQVSTDASFTTVIKDTTFGSTSKQMWGLLNSTKYYWRVRANNVGGTGNWSEVWNFTTIIAAPGQVTLSSPANNATNQALNVSLSWNQLTGAETYELQVSTDANFTTIVKDTALAGTSKQMWNLSNSTNYYWRVRANNVGGTGSWSEVWNFTTIIAAPGTVTLASPANNATNQALNVSLNWNALSGAETYQLQVSTDANFTTIVKDTTFGSNSKQMWGLLNSTKYYWRVRASNVGGTGSWSVVWNFTTIIAAPGSVTLSSPANNAINQALNVSLSWNQLSGAETYQLQVSTDANFTTIVKDTALAGTSKQMWGLLNSTKYYWRVRANNVGGTGSWSEVWNFTTIVANPTSVLLQTPANNSINVALNTTLTWSPLSGAETYQLQVSTDANFTTIVKDTTFGGTSKQMSGLLNSTKYYWRVRASNVGGTGNWSELWDFTTIIAAPGQVVLSTPANNATNQALNVTLNWNQLSGAETYQLQVATDANFTTVIKDTTFGSTSKQMWGLLNSTKYYWRVRASNVGGTGSWSEVWNFTTIIAAPGQVTLSNPANNATNQALNVTLNWNALSGAETYQLQVATDANFTNVVKDTTFGSTSKQMWNLSNSTKYYWRVRANNVGGTGSWSEVWNFTTIIAAPGVVTLASPANNAINQALNVSLSWNQLSGAETYQLQVATDANFTTVIKDTTFGSTSKQMWGLLNSTKYYWRVRANNVGGTGNWSEVWNFTTIISNPTSVLLQTPANNSINVALNTTLTWSPLSGAETYQLQVATDANFTTIVKDTALAGTSKQMWGLLNSTKYYWRVRANNVGGTGSWSEVWNFTTIISAPGQVTLSSPANNAVNQSLSTSLSWNALSGAETYQLQIATDANFTTIVKDTTFGGTSKQMWNLSNLTKYYWRVRANNVGGTGSWSEIWNFTTIIAAPGQVTLSSPANNATNQALNVSLNWNAISRAETYQLQVSTDANFTTVIKDTTFGSTSKQMWNLSNLTKYYWRVRANNVGGTGSWSEVWNFTTIIAAPGQVTLSSPANNAVNQSLSTSLSWNALSGAETYQLQVSTDANFTTVIKDTTFGSTSKQMWGLLNSTKYYWRVRANNIGGTGNWSEVWNFTTIIAAPGQVTLSNPANNSKGLLNPVTVSWNSSARAEKYILQVSTSSTFTSFVLNDSTQTDLTASLPLLNNYTQYYWRVKSVNVGGQSDWSEVWNFKTLGNPYASTLYVPANNSVNQSITGLLFRWSKAQERMEAIQKYQFQLATDAQFTSIVTNDTTLTDTTKSLSGLTYLTKYYWRVRAQNQTGWGDWSAVWNTTTIIEKPANFTLSAPANNSKGLLNPVTVIWNSSARAEKYILQVSTSSTFTSFVVNDSNQTDLTEVLPTLANYTQYYWRVKSVNVGGQSDWSEVWNFKTLGNPYASTLYTPANNSVNQPVTGLVFKWSKAQERMEAIQKYQFQLATDSLFTSLVSDDSTLTDTTKTVNSLSYLTKYYWKVRAQNQTGWGDWSEVWNTTTIIEKPANFTLSAPANNSKGLLNPVTVSWNTSARAEKYILQVSISSSFNTFVLNDSTQTDLTEVLPTLNNYTEYFWRVKSLNIGGQSDWSEVWNFKTLGNPYASTLYTPANNSFNQPVTGLVFKWSKAQERMEAIQKYQWQLATDSLFNAIVSNDSTLTDTIKTINSLSYLTKYYWRVRAQNQTGWGDWSEVWNTTTLIDLPGIPVLVYPGNNSQNIPLVPVFVWNSAPRSVKYLLQISDTSDFSSIAIQDSSVTDTSKSITGLQQGKVYFWRVKASNAAGWGNFSATAKFTTVLFAPTQLTAAVVNLRNIQLTWIDNAVNESGYSVERKTGDTASTNAYAVIAENLSPNTVTFVDTAAVYADPALKFSYRVRAVNAVAQSQYSNQSSVQFTIPAPILVSPADNVRELRDSVKLVWRSLQGSVGIAQPGQMFGYHLQVAFDSLFTNLMLNDSTMTDTAKTIMLADGNKYYWRVRGKMIVYGEFSPFWRYTSAINTPDSLTAVYDPDQRKVILNWRDKSSSETGFIIERKDSTGNYVFLATAPADAQSYEDAQMSLWSTFMYRIQSYNGYDSSEYIESQSVFTDIHDLAQIPEEYQLSQNYPNPFNPSTVIRFGVPHSSSVEIVLYNLQGQLVMELYRGEVSPGFYELKSDLSLLSSGIYFYRIVARSSESEIFTQTRKLSLIK